MVQELLSMSDLCDNRGIFSAVWMDEGKAVWKQWHLFRSCFAEIRSYVCDPTVVSSLQKISPEKTLISESLQVVVRLKIERKRNYKSTWDKQEYNFLSPFLKVLFSIMAFNSSVDYLNYVTVLLTKSVYIVVVWVNSLLMTSTDDYKV